MLKIFKFDREVYPGAEVRERADYYENGSNRINELSRSNVKPTINDLKALEDEIEAEYHCFDKLLLQVIVTNFEDNSILVVNTYIEFISSIATHLHGANNSKYLSNNIDEFRHALAYIDIRDLLDSKKTCGHHQTANVGRDLRAIGSDSQEYALLSWTHMLLTNPSNKSYRETSKVWERTNGNLFDNETFKGYINKRLMNRFK